LFNTNVSKNTLTGDVTPQGKMDLAEGNGMISECCAKRLKIKKKQFILLAQKKN
jgi:hypothetical protein